MSARRNIRLLPEAVLAAIFLTACVAPAPEVAKGEDVKAAMRRQVQNPERSETRTPVEGLGATTAADVVTNYHENQTTSAQTQRQERQRDNGLSDAR